MHIPILVDPGSTDHLDIEQIMVQNGSMMLETGEAWTSASRELLRAIRGKRSQVQFSRWLGYRSNVAADWEGGHRSPTASTLFHAMQRVGIDVNAGFMAFHPGSADAFPQGLPRWLREVRGRASQGQIAERAGASRHQVRRWMSGEAEPRVPQLLGLIHALTGRAPDWVASFVNIAEVPTLHAPYRSARTAARLAYDHPWTSAIRMLIDSDAYRAEPTDAFLGQALGIAADELSESVEALISAGLAERLGARLRPLSTFTSDAKVSGKDRVRLKAHWAQVAADRLRDGPRADDLVSLNLAVLSRDDLVRVRDLQREYFRALRSLVASSTPEEEAVLVMMQVMSLMPDDGSSV